MMTGGLTFLPCDCPCDILHAGSPGICEKTPVVATLQAQTDLGTVNLLLCPACANMAREHNLPLLESVETDSRWYRGLRP
jgi:hypothetical protein